MTPFFFREQRLTPGTIGVACGQAAAIQLQAGRGISLDNPARRLAEWRLKANRRGSKADWNIDFPNFAGPFPVHEPNVKALTRYINEHIGKLPRQNGKPPFEPVAISRVQRTFSIAGVSKVRGHGRRQAA